MSAPHRITQPEASSESSEFVILLRLLEEAEFKYKLGDVDDRVTIDDKGSVQVWAFELELNRIDELVNKHRERLLAESPAWYYKFLATQAEAKEYYDTATAT